MLLIDVTGEEVLIDFIDIIASLIAMFVVGGIIMIAFFTWEFKFATFPLMPRRVMNKTMVSVKVNQTYLRL